MLVNDRMGVVIDDLKIEFRARRTRKMYNPLSVLHFGIDEMISQRLCRKTTNKETNIETQFSRRLTGCYTKIELYVYIYSVTRAIYKTP